VTMSKVRISAGIQRYKQKERSDFFLYCSPPKGDRSCAKYSIYLSAFN